MIGSVIRIVSWVRCAGFFSGSPSSDRGSSWPRVEELSRVWIAPLIVSRSLSINIIATVGDWLVGRWSGIDSIIIYAIYCLSWRIDWTELLHRSGLSYLAKSIIIIYILLWDLELLRWLPSVSTPTLICLSIGTCRGPSLLLSFSGCFYCYSRHYRIREQLATVREHI